MRVLGQSLKHDTMHGKVILQIKHALIIRLNPNRNAQVILDFWLAELDYDPI